MNEAAPGFLSLTMEEFLLLRESFRAWMILKANPSVESADYMAKHIDAFFSTLLKNVREEGQFMASFNEAPPEDVES